MTPSELALASGFAAATRAQWEELAKGVEGSRTYDGITRAPLYTAADTAPRPGLPGLAPFVRGGRGEAGAWDVRQRHTEPDAAAVLADLENGATSLWLAGLPAGSLPEVLDEVYLDLAPVTLDAGADPLPAARVLLELHADKGIAPDDVRGNLGADPVGWRARTGTEADLDTLTAVTELAAGHPHLRTVVVDALSYHEAGGSDAEELGCALATGVAYLRALPENSVGRLEFRYAATVDQFLTIAKFRAARRLWARVTEVATGTPRPQLQHAVTSPAMMTRRDPWVNMLRTTVACFAAGVGGADAVTVLPFDSALGRPDAFGRRIARNTQSILLEESFVANVIDPAGESWYVERLTDDLARAAWSWFQEIERAGGILAALDSGAVADRLERTWSARKDNLAGGTDRITGVTVFANPDEEPLTRPAATPPPSGGLPRVRYSEEFE
jgi:methylmalonyl-CoA mutase